jgi:hypothetical protein
MTAVPAWSRVLDEFGRCLEQQEELVAAGEYGDVVAFAPPAGLGPLPVELEFSARRLLARARALEDALEQEVDAARRRDRMLRRMQVMAPPAPAYTELRV